MTWLLVAYAACSAMCAIVLWRAFALNCSYMQDGLIVVSIGMLTVFWPITLALLAAYAYTRRNNKKLTFMRKHNEET